MGKHILASTFVFFALVLGTQARQTSQTKPAPASPPQQSQNPKPDPQKDLTDKLDQALAAKDWAQVEDLAQQLIDLDPTQGKFYSALGDAQSHTGKLEQAIQRYEQAFDLISKETDTPPNPERAATRSAALGHILLSEGNTYLRLRKNDDAIRCYTKAAAVDPHPAIAYFNICAVEYDGGNMDAVVPACDKAIAADPSRANAYFIKGSALYGKSRMDKVGNVIAPPECIEALNKYLELAPNGPHAADVRAMLQMAAPNH